MPIRFSPTTGKKKFELHAREEKWLNHSIEILRAMADCQVTGASGVAASIGELLESLKKPAKTPLTGDGK